MIILVLIVFVVHQTSGVIYRLTPSEYDKLPKVTKLDAYGPCMRGPGDTYCFVHARLHGNLSDPLYNTIVEYSADSIKHFDHTRIHWGICPKTSCAEHMNISTNLTDVIEACLNKTLTRDYRLTAKVYETMCNVYEEGVTFDASDYIFGAVLLALIVLTVLGSLYDFYDLRSRFGSRFFLCFSVRRNWASLAAPASASPMQRRIKVIYSLKTITSCLVVLAHSGFPNYFIPNNTQFVEGIYYNLLYQILLNGTHIVQTFFLISAILLAYNVLLKEKKRPSSFKDLPDALFHRWLRMTPVYAFVMFYAMTWARHLGDGPNLQTAITTEALDCRRDWWLHLLYIQNYKDHSMCMIHCWYLAADFQLSVVGSLIFYMLFNNRHRKIAIGVLIAVGLLTPAVQTFVQDIYPVLIVSPEVLLNLLVHDPTFNNSYKRGHTNIICYGLGLALAYVIYNLKESDLGANKFKKYRYLYWLLFPLMIVTFLTGTAFYQDGIVVPFAVRVIYASAIKLIFGSLTLLFLFFTAVKVDGAFRGFLHWGGWAQLSRLTFSVYLVHVPLLRAIVGSTDELLTAGILWMLLIYFALLSLSFLLAVPVFIFVEAPIAEVVRVATGPAPRPKAKPVTTVGQVAASKDSIPVTLEDLQASKETLQDKP